MEIRKKKETLAAEANISENLAKLQKVLLYDSFFYLTISCILLHSIIYIALFVSFQLIHFVCMLTYCVYIIIRTSNNPL